MFWRLDRIFRHVPRNNLRSRSQFYRQRISGRKVFPGFNSCGPREAPKRTGIYVAYNPSRGTVRTEARGFLCRMTEEGIPTVGSNIDRNFGIGCVAMSELLYTG